MIAIDGPSGTGKSTVARGVAARLGLRYLDTGAMYRAATLAALQADADLAREEQVIDVVSRTAIDISTDPAAPGVWLNGQRVDAEIRSASVTTAVSPVSAVAAVRARLVAAQRRLIGDGAIVVEGRDIATVVWPHAEVKIYVTAEESVRAQRRAEQLGVTDVSGVATALADRDRFDSARAASPLTRAATAFELDTSA
ncbi:MAG: (d)CMP kinase, partial [Actinobacteria bacterium]|nr:(d)CMP kinase [Actinomycetota bacterium]